MMKNSIKNMWKAYLDDMKEALIVTAYGLAGDVEGIVAYRQVKKAK